MGREQRDERTASALSTSSARMRLADCARSSGVTSGGRRHAARSGRARSCRSSSSLTCASRERVEASDRSRSRSRPDARLQVFSAANNSNNTQLPELVIQFLCSRISRMQHQSIGGNWGAQQMNKPAKRAPASDEMSVVARERSNSGGKRVCARGVRAGSPRRSGAVRARSSENSKTAELLMRSG